MNARAWRHFRSPAVYMAAAFLAVLAVVALLAPVLPLTDPLRVNMGQRLVPPSETAWMGTDSFGRDQLSRLLWGARISLLVGATAVLLGGFIGCAIGLFAGYVGGTWDSVLMRLMDILLAFPALVLAMAVAAALGADLRNAVLAVALVSVPTYARLLRSVVLRLKSAEFIEASRALGASNMRIALRHLLANAYGPILVQATLGFGQAILAVAGLSFIGLGAQAPTPEWGAMITEGRYYVLSGRWWLTVFPGIAIGLTVLAFNVLGDRFRDAFDPRIGR